MGVTTADVWTKALIGAGKDPATPTAIIRRCSLPDQQSIHCRLDEVARHLTPASKFRPPVITIIGPVTELADSMDWVTRRPLHGQTILVTRPIEKSESLAGPLRDLGATVLIQPAIQTGPATDPSSIDDAIANFSVFDAVLFCSENGVQYFMDRLLAHPDHDLRSFAAKKIGCVGSKTAEKLREKFYLRCDWLPDEFHATGLADKIGEDLVGKRVLIVRASRGADTLSKRLTQTGAEVVEAVAYQNSDVDVLDPDIARQMQAGQIDWITVTSSATARNLWRMFGDALGCTKIASLSPVTSQAPESLGIGVQAEADCSTIDSLIEKILAS